jgi:iron(III) transport system substrate-binding protein
MRLSHLRGTCGLAAFGLALGSLPASAQTGRDIGPIVSYAGPDRTEKLAAEAKKEGLVSLYSSATVEDMGQHIKAFEAKFGVKVTLWRGDSEGIAQRAITEHRAGRDAVDVIETSGINLESLHREGILQPVSAPIQAEIIPAGIPVHHEYTATRLQIHVNAYNTNVIRKADLPKTWDDLADPKWKGKLGIEADDGDWFGQVLHVMGEQKGLDVFRRIALNGVSLRKGHTLLANLTVSGEVPLSLSVYEYKIRQMNLGGAPIDLFYLDPVMVHPIGIGIAKAAPHPNAAALFFDFMLSEGQKIYLDQQTYPSNVKVKPLPQGVALHFMDFAQALDEQDRWTKIYKETFLSRPR